MEAAVSRRGAPSSGSVPLDSGRQKAVSYIRLLIWLYLALLIIEGALRKWVLPQFSDPLLIVRDPVAILIYLFAIRARVFPRNFFILSLGIIALLSCLAGMLVLMPYLPPKIILFVTLYGFRSNFLHLPLIFVIANVFDAADVKKMGWWILAGLIPMALLMAAQFRASPEAAINRTVGLGEGEQITAGGGKIRPPGTFSFISGVIFYLSSAAAFLLHGILTRTTYKNWLLIAGGFALVVAVAVSGSRSAVASVGLVVLSLLIIVVIRPEAVNQFGRSLLLVVIIGWGISHLPIFKEGIGILSDRFTESAAAAESTIAGGLLARTYSGFVEGFRVFDRLPLFGYGLGIGTNGGAKFVTGRASFLLAEGEWARVLLESGPIFGLMFLCWRTVLTIRLAWLSLRALAYGETLSMILFSAGFVALLDGQFGQPTILGFAVLLSGLCLASTNVGSEAASPIPAQLATSSPSAIPAMVGGRSPYAARLHGTNGGQAKTNGSVDR
jgi:hypothetical protein